MKTVYSVLQENRISRICIYIFIYTNYIYMIIYLYIYLFIETYFKELAHMIVRATKSEVHRSDQQAGNSQTGSDVAIRGRVSSSSVLLWRPFNWLMRLTQIGKIISWFESQLIVDVNHIKISSQQHLNQCLIESLGITV